MPAKTVRNRIPGIVKPKTENQVRAEITRAEKEAEKKEHTERLEETWEIVHPTDGTDVAYHSGNAGKFTGDAGMAWRGWLANAPVTKK